MGAEVHVLPDRRRSLTQAARVGVGGMAQVVLGARGVLRPARPEAKLEHHELDGRVDETLATIRAYERQAVLHLKQSGGEPQEEDGGEEPTDWK